MRVNMTTAKFAKELTRIVDYSVGFLEGVQAGKSEFLAQLGAQTVELVKQYIDSSARSNPAMLHHIYEWDQVGKAQGRLYDINFTISNLGLSFKSGFRQSTSIKKGSKVPFAEKARIMEEGRPVVIRPKESPVLVFKGDNDELVFTPNPVLVTEPGGAATTGGFEKIFDEIFSKYFSQSFFRVIGISKYLENPVAYKNNLRRAKTGGKNAGKSVGYRWIVNAGRVR